MKKLFLIIIILSFAVFASADLVQNPKARIAPEDFCIMPWNVWAEIDFQPEQYDELMSDMYNCGFNVSGIITPEYAKYAKKYNLKTQLITDRPNSGKSYEEDAKLWAENLQKTLPQEVKDNVFQYFIKDEPFVKDFDEMFAYGKAVKHILKSKAYITFNPIQASEIVIGKDYDKYCDELTKGCELDFLAYDNYAFKQTKGLVEDQFYSNLEAVKRVSDRNNCSFMNIVLSVQHFNYEKPNDYMIYCQGFSSLAYGAKGLSYFTMFEPQRADFRNAPYDRYGTKTQLWYIIRNMNFAIHNLGPYYKDLKNINVFHVGNVPKGCNDISSAKNIKKISASNLVETKTNFLVGEFIGKDNKEYALIVNKDPNYSMVLNTIEFNKGKKIIHISDLSRNNPEMELKGEDFWLAPGYGMLLRAE